MKKAIIFLTAIFFVSVAGIGSLMAWNNARLEDSRLAENREKEQNDKENSGSKVTDAKLKEAIGQMMIVGFRGTQAPDDSYIKSLIENVGIGGVILFDYDVSSKSFPRNIINPQQTKKLIEDMQSYSEIPLFVSVDAEGGSVNRLKGEYGFLNISSAQEMGQRGIATTKAESGKLAKELFDLGFNMNFAPVVDVNINAQNPIIGKLGRSFSADEVEVVEHAVAFIQEHIAAGIIPVAKHFPGHGSSTSDSHLGIVDVTDTYSSAELTPYKGLQKENLLEAVMTAHIINKNVDKEYPATLSSLFLQNSLRQQIGFNGVIISDDMNMGAIVNNYRFEEAIIRAVNAGCDIILLSNNGAEAYDEELPYKAADIIYKAVKEGKISEERILESYERISNLKKRFRIVK